MGRDPALTDGHPSIIINQGRYHYGKHPDPQYDHYLVEHATNGKDYWWFPEKQDLEAFLINLPGSADRNLRRKLHPDWQDVTPEQRDAYFEQDKLLFREWAAEKVTNVTAPSFNMDLEGEHGPYSPQRVLEVDAEPPLERVERQLADYKSSHAPPARDPRLPAGPVGDLIHGLSDLSWGSGLSEAGKLRVLEGNLDWTGVDPADKEAILSREVDFARITRRQFDFVYEDVARDHFQPPDSSVALKLFEKVNPGKLAAQPSARGRDKDPGLEPEI